MKKILYFWLVVFSIITYKAQTTTWNGSSWSNGKPNASTDAIISADYSQSANLAVKNMTINSGKNFTLKSNFQVIVYGSVVNNGTLIVESNASFVHRNNTSTYSGSGTALVKREAKLKRNDYNYWSSPVANQNIYNFSIGTPARYFFKYKEKDDRFYANEITANSTFELGIGYAIRGKDSYALETPTTETFLFSGIPNNGTYSKVLQRSVGSDKGYNLIGNPYPSNFNLAAFAKAATNRNSLVGKFWFWSNINQVTSQQGSSYAGNNYATYVVDVGGIGPTYVSGSTEEISLRPTGTARVAQGFMVQAKYNNAPIYFTNAMRATTNGGSIFYNKTNEGDDNGEDEPQEPEPIIDRYWLKLINPDNIANDILIAHIAEATNNYDEDYDAALFTMGNDTFYSAVGTNKLQIQARALPISDSDVIPLAYKTSKAGNCIIALNDKDGVFKDSNKAIYLKDKVTGTVTNLQEGYYTFNSEVLTTPNDSRFEILYANSVLAADNTATNQWIVYKQDTDWVVRGNDRINGLDLYDASGKLVRSLAGNNTVELRVSNVGLLKGLYVIKIKTGKGTVTKKLLN
ncbi:T9SS C-terminal target domain-containing protein [Epilithonimonas vandammei]|uniref:T9SS C-terminal target domain-containing protein n=1 Tax=Epilithonimonas vandammei TaxID=2487072 RepID=A0A3G8ZC48_9FLAO|nr:T9SS type A sorting domain-containing protein [Epilithonimonas vandammei]AZI54295.1 T9SS C-terminal target domain-containing protein [Epilithonimonas vandammei]